MDNKSSWSSCAFELEDIEIIDHKNGNEEKAEKKWHCDQCSLFFLEKGKLDEHKKKHNKKETVNCKYCDKIISVSEGNKASLVNRKCETCEYKCSKCPRRFLRHSSLVNHEKKHSSPKKKKDLCNNKKVNGVCPENGAVSKGVKRKLSEIDDSEEEIKALKKTKKILIVQKSQKKKLHSQVGTQAVSDNENPSIKSPKRLSTKEIKLEEKTNNCEDSPNKVNKRLSFKGDKQSNEKHSPVKSKLTAVNPQAVSTPPNVSSTSSENVVNYKPFSCHVCGDTFASDGALLGHIKTHGENAAKSFKCKFCGDEFDDIYKMQYHLAICPLAEDELESSLKQVLPVSKPMTFSAPPLSPRKRGRPKRLVESPSTEENESTQSPLNNRSVRKRRSVIPELNEMGQTTITSKQPRKSSNFQKSSVSGSNRVGGENVNDTLSSDITEVSKNNEPDDDRKKLHQCPFPRCDFKFTREKALLCHMRNHSDDFDDSLKCHKCDIPFEDIHALRLHINMCKGIKEEKDDDFNRAKSYDSSPNRTFQRAMKKDFVCNQCGRSYQSQEKLNRCTHKDTQSPRLMVCRICSDKFEDEHSLKDHFKSTHPKSYPYQCTTCKAEFETTFAEYEHRMVHIKGGEQFKCLICSADFLTYKELYFHYSKDHVEQAQSICKICNITFPNHFSLEEHNYVRHKGNDRFTCLFCHKAYSSSTSLTTHMKQHTSKILKCKICYRPFTDLSLLVQHMLFHASTSGTERPLKCVVCLASYAKQSALKYHITGHIAKSSSSFHCQICGDILPDSESWTDHIFDHSIAITENNMTKSESEWIEELKERKPVVKPGRPRLLSNHDTDYKSIIKLENEETQQGRGRPRKINFVNEDTQPIKNKRGRPRKMQFGNEETPKKMQENGKTGNQFENQGSATTKKCSIKTDENQIQSDNQTARKSGRLVKENNKSWKDTEMEIDQEKKSDKAEKKSRRISKERIIPTNSDVLSNNRAHDISTEKNDSISNKCNGVSREKGKPSNIETGSNKPVSTSRARLRRNKNVSKVQQVVTHNVETKARPMSFKLFSSLANTRAPSLAKKEIKQEEEVVRVENPLSDSSGEIEVKEEIFDDEEDPLGGIEIPYVSERKGLRSSERLLNGGLDVDSFNSKKDATEAPNHEISVEFDDITSIISNGFIKEKKYFEPSKGLTKYSCTTCLMSFLSQEELMFHNTIHII